MTVVKKIKNLDEKQCVVNVLLDSVKAHPCKDCGKCVTRRTTDRTRCK